MIGMKAPDFSLGAGDGKTYALKDFQGRNLLLVFYCMNDTPG